MELNELVQSLDAEGHRRLQQIVALGRWPDARPLTETERETCLQALIGFEAGLPENERSGYIAQRCHNSQSVNDDTQKVRLTS